MTAEVIITTRAAAGFPVFQGIGSGVVQAAYGVTEIASGNLLEANDIIKFCKVPAGATIIGGWIYGDDIDTGTETLDIDIGWAANGGTGTWDAVDTDGFGNLGTITGDAITDLKPVAGIIYPLQGLLLADGPITFTRETTITAIVNTAAAGGAVGTLSMVVFYLVD